MSAGGDVDAIMLTASERINDEMEWNLVQELSALMVVRACVCRWMASRKRDVLTDIRGICVRACASTFKNVVERSSIIIGGHSVAGVRF
jgi:hypothetical protein